MAGISSLISRARFAMLAARHMLLSLFSEFALTSIVLFDLDNVSSASDATVVGPPQFVERRSIRVPLPLGIMIATFGALLPRLAMRMFLFKAPLIHLTYMSRGSQCTLCGPPSVAFGEYLHCMPEIRVPILQWPSLPRPAIRHPFTVVTATVHDRAEESRTGAPATRDVTAHITSYFAHLSGARGRPCKLHQVLPTISNEARLVVLGIHAGGRLAMLEFLAGEAVEVSRSKRA